MNTPAQTNADELLDSPVAKVLYKLGVLLSHTKDALLKDFLGDMPSYLPEISDSENYTFDTFVENLKPGETPLGKFIESLFARLGYDISSFEKNKELADNIKSIIAITTSFSESIKNLFDGKTDWMSEAQEFMKEDNEGKDKKLVTAREFFSDPDLDSTKGITAGNKNISVELDFGSGSGKIFDILHLIVDLISLVRKFRDMEWDKLGNEYEEFGSFLEKTYFNQKFTERIFDHVFVVILQNAKEVFADDINTIVDHIEDLKAAITEEVQGEAKEKLEAILTQIKNLRREIKELEAVREVSTESQTQLKIARTKLDKLANEAFGDYNRIGKTFSQIYAVLDFLKVIKKETIEIAKYVPGTPAIPTINITDVNQLIEQANSVVTEANKDIDEVNQEIESAVTSLKSLCPTVEINTIHWSNLEKLCTDPIAYFKTIYPVKDYDDAEVLLTKIIEVVRAFNADIPDFGSLKQILYEFLLRIRDKIKDAVSPLTNDIKEKFAQFENFIIDLLKVLEKFAVGVKRELKIAYSDFEANKESLIGQLKDGINGALAEIKNSGGTVKSFTIPDTNIKFKKIKGVEYGEIKGYLKKAFADPFIQVIKEKAREHDLFRDVKPDDWKVTIEKSINDNLNGNIIREYKVILDEIETYVTDLFDSNQWGVKFDGIIKELKKEFEQQTKNVPDNFDEVANFCKGSLGNLINGENIRNPFSDFDFTAYFGIVSDNIKGIVPNNPDVYYIKLREATIVSVQELVHTNNVVFKTVGENEEIIRNFAVDVFTAYWREFKQSLYRTTVRPFITIIEKAIKAWIRDVLMPRIIDFAQENIINELNLEQYKEVFNEVEAFAKDVKGVYDEVGETATEVRAWAKDATQMATNILTLAADAKEVDSWRDGLQFALKLYKIIPPTIKNNLRELIDLPNWNFDNINLPDYKLDVQNKFMAVTLYEYIDKEKGTIDVNVSIRLLAFVADRKIKDKTDEDGDDVYESGLYLLPVIRGKFGADFNAGESHHIVLSANAAMNPDVTTASANEEETKQALESDSLGFFFTTKEGESVPTVELLNSEAAISAYLELLFKRGQNNSVVVEPLEIFKADIAEMTVADYPQKVFIGYNNGFDCGYLGSLRNLVLKLKLREINDFFSKILKNDIDIELEKLDLGYSLKEGFQIDGKYKIHIPINANIDLRVIKFSNIGLDLGGGARNIQANLLTTFTVDFEGIALSFSDMGFGFDINYMSPTRGFGDLKLSPNIQFPTGVAVSIDMPAVKATGIIKWDKKKEEFLGALELSILDGLCGASALVLFNMKMPDGRKGFSFMGAVSVFFNPGIQLSMGFALTGIGGSLGINRRIDIDKLRDAVHDGSLAAILFVENLDKNLDVVLGNISSYYPIQEDQFFFGFLAKISWTKIVNVSLGIFIQAPRPTTIIIAGFLNVKIADASESLFDINVYFMGGIDFDKGLFFDASLVDSKIVGIEFYGDVALRIYWAGATKGFLLSAGGFHPQYTPEPGFNVGGMKRLGMKLDYSILCLSFETYFAITSNSVQFGAKAQLRVGWEKFGLSGYLYFDVLFQFNPFYFTVGMGTGLAVRIGSLTLCSISLAFELSGPARWNAKGKAEFWFMFIKVDVNFNKSWGKKQSNSDTVYVEVLDLYTENFHESSNWRIISDDIIDGLVGLVKVSSPELVMHPSDRLSFAQSAVPLDQDMVHYGEAFPGDAQKITLKKVKIGDEPISYGKTVASFAPTLIRELDKEEKLIAPSYEDMNAGFELKAGSELEKGGVELSTSEYEKKYQDIDWNLWEQYSSASSTPKLIQGEAKVPVSILDTPIKFTGSRTTHSQRLASKIKKTPTSRVSFRRTNNGFKRYTLELDQRMNARMDHFIAELDVVSTK